MLRKAVGVLCLDTLFLSLPYFGLSWLASTMWSFFRPLYAELWCRLTLTLCASFGIALIRRPGRGESETERFLTLEQLLSSGRLTQESADI